MGYFKKANPIFKEAIAMELEAAGKEHQNYPQMLWGMAHVYEAEQQYADSEQLMAEISALEQHPLLKGSSYLSENELALFSEKYSAEGNRFSSLLLTRVNNGRNLGILPAINYDHQLFQKGFLLTAAGRLNVLAASSPETKDLSIRLKGYQRQLTTEYSKPIAERNQVVNLEEKVNDLEKQLSRQVAGYTEAVRQVKWQEVQATLKPTEVAIEFVHFKADFYGVSDSMMYAALLLFPGATQPDFIPLFEEKQLDSLLFRVDKRSDVHIKQLYSSMDTGGPTETHPKKTLYDLIWKPLEKSLSGVTTIYFSPSGLLYRINLAAIPLPPDAVVGNQYHLVELGSTRQLVVREEVKSPNQDALLFGGIRYELDANDVPGNLDSLHTMSRGALDFADADSTLRLGTWNVLPYSVKEVLSVDQILKKSGLKSVVLQGSTATEEAFKSVGIGSASPRVLHIATHGFFYPDPKFNPQRSHKDDLVFRTSDHPMIRSGLLLAGANQAWKTGKPLRNGMEDGVLTAYEISQMNLSNTELVVLSACETGLGDIQGNEGVYGLQRAFKIAGAKYLIMSLYKVPDRETAEFMTVFYKKWLKEKMEIPDAFRDTQKELRKRFPNPYSWAGFVLLE
jgi:CHAT domain-containing protein